MIIPFSSFTQEEIPFTLDDREKLIQIEEKLNSTNERINSTNERINSTNERITSLEKQMNIKFESQQNQIDDLKIMFRWGFSILITLMLFILGYIIWDRRTALNPIRERVEQEKIEVEKIKAVLKEMGESDQKIAEILKRTAMF
jgi:uncharacterized protein YlxW (UPF0749 family)